MVWKNDANSMPIAPEPTTSSDFGILLRHHRLEIGPDQLLVGLEPRQHARPRAGREDDVLGLVGALAQRALGRFDCGFLHRDLAGRIDRRLAPDHRHLVLLHQEADAVIEAL